MPYKTEKLKLDNYFIDKRTKLLPCQKERVYHMYYHDNYSLNQLAKIFHCSKRLIHFIVKPEKKEKADLQYKERRKDKRYYDKEKHKNAMNKHRKRKHELLKNIQ